MQPGSRHFTASRRTVGACTRLAGRLVGVAAQDVDGACLEERLAAAHKALADGRPMGLAHAPCRKT